MSRPLRIAVQGCCHGELDRVYATLDAYATSRPDLPPADLLLCCGDFQSIRNASDLDTMAVPPKYRSIGTFHRYYSGEVRAPILTVFVGGNHEASGYLRDLHYGGWVAPNVYYLGAAGAVRFGGIRVAGLSGIYKSHDYGRGRYETVPYDRSSLRSVYHVRNVDVYRLKCLGMGWREGLDGETDDPRQSRRRLRHRGRVDVMISHDWPRGIERHGDTEALLRKKRFFRKEVEDNCLGSPANEEVLKVVRPLWWFAAHLHVKFEAQYRHGDDDGDGDSRGGRGRGGGDRNGKGGRGRTRSDGGDGTDALGIVPSQVGGRERKGVYDRHKDRRGPARPHFWRPGSHSIVQQSVGGDCARMPPRTPRVVRFPRVYISLSYVGRGKAGKN